MSSKNVHNLFKSAKDEGILTNASVQALNVPDIGATIQAALGVNVDDVTASEVVLVTQMIDDSGSIRFAGNVQAIRDGHNLVLDEVLKNTKQADSILAHTRFLNGEIIFPYSPIDQAVKLNKNNYNPGMGTPLFDETVVMLGTVLAKYQEFADNGVPVRTISLITSDGEDVHSSVQTAKTVASIVKDMLATEEHIIAAMGVDNGNTDFNQVFGEMGIPDEWIFTTMPQPGETAEDHARRIRRGFQLFSRSAVRASQNAASFSQTAMAGFGN